MDILSVPSSDRTYVRVIDYKSGSDRFDMDEVKSGFRLQLMLYLKGAMGGIGEAVPAGVFYFRISDAMADVSGVRQPAWKRRCRRKSRAARSWMASF